MRFFVELVAAFMFGAIVGFAICHAHNIHFTADYGDAHISLEVKE